MEMPRGGWPEYDSCHSCLEGCCRVCSSLYCTSRLTHAALVLVTNQQKLHDQCARMPRSQTVLLVAVAVGGGGGGSGGGALRVDCACGVQRSTLEEAAANHKTKTTKLSAAHGDAEKNACTGSREDTTEAPPTHTHTHQVPKRARPDGWRTGRPACVSFFLWRVYYTACTRWDTDLSATTPTG